MPRRTAVLIGNGTFSDPEELPDLRGPATEVPLLLRVLGDDHHGRFDDVVTLLDEDHHRVLQALDQRLSRAARDDMVLIYYSGHGKRTLNGQLCLATRDTSPELITTTSIPFLYLKQLTENSQCENVVLLLDCCFSGAVSESFGLKGGSVAEQLQEVARETSGLHILTSSARYQPSREAARDGGPTIGEFTRVLLEGLETGAADGNGDGVIHLSELNAYIQREIRNQTPQYWGFRVHGDPVIAVNPRHARTAPVEAARQRLAGWHREKRISRDVFLEAVSFLRVPDGEPPSDDQETIVDLLLDPRCEVHHFHAGWEALHPEQPQRERAPALPPVKRGPAGTTGSGGGLRAGPSGPHGNPAAEPGRPAAHGREGAAPPERPWISAGWAGLLVGALSGFVLALVLVWATSSLQPGNETDPDNATSPSDTTPAATAPMTVDTGMATSDTVAAATDSYYNTDTMPADTTYP
jgi:hypothetical protein